MIPDVVKKQEVCSATSGAFELCAIYIGYVLHCFLVRRVVCYVLCSCLIRISFSNLPGLESLCR